MRISTSHLQCKSNKYFSIPQNSQPKLSHPGMPLQSTRRGHLVFKPDIKNQQPYLYNPGEAGFVGARVWNRILSPSKVRTSCGGGLLTRALTAKAR